MGRDASTSIQSLPLFDLDFLSFQRRIRMARAEFIGACGRMGRSSSSSVSFSIPQGQLLLGYCGSFELISRGICMEVEEDLDQVMLLCEHIFLCSSYEVRCSEGRVQNS